MAHTRTSSPLSRTQCDTVPVQIDSLMADRHAQRASPTNSASSSLITTTWSKLPVRTTTLTVTPTGAVTTEQLTPDTHLIHTGGWMGDLRVLTDDGWSTIHIRDPKLTDAMWNRLLDDLSAAVVALPLAELVDGSSVEATTDASTVFVQRLIARAYADTITRAIDAIEHRPHERLSVHDSWVTPDRATVASPGAIAAVLERGAITRNGPLARTLGGVAQTSWRDVERTIETDTPENRFARHALEHVLTITRQFPDDDRLAELATAIRIALRRRPLRDAGPYRRYPATSRVLQQRYGYRELRDVHFALLGGARVRWNGLDTAIRGGLRNTELLYQWWCFVALQRHLGSERPTLPHRRTPSALHVELAEGLPAAVDTPAGRLWHERTFDRPHGTYAIQLRPDFALARPDGGWSVFDAKFRIDHHGDAKHPDLTKMHAYRDAIRGCHSATVLYPGERPESFPVTPDQPSDDPSGIGVLPMRP